MKKIYLIILCVFVSLNNYSQSIVNYAEAISFNNSLCFYNNLIYYSGTVNTYCSDKYGKIVNCYQNVHGDQVEVDFEGKIWVGYQGGGLYYIHDSKVDTFASNFVNFMKKDKNNCLWIGMRSVLIRISPDGIDTIANKEYNQIAFSPVDNSVWLTNQYDGISKYDGSTITSYSYLSKSFYYIAIDNDNNVLVTSNGLIYKYANDTWEEFADKNGLKAKMLGSILYADSKLYTFSSNYGAIDSLLVLQDNQWTKSALPKLFNDDSNSNFSRNLSLSDKGNICMRVASYENLYYGYLELINGQWEYTPLYLNYYPTYTVALCVDSLKHIWFGSLGSLGFISGNKFNYIESSYSWYYDLATDQDGKVWFGGSSNKFGYWDFNSGLTDLSSIFESTTTVYSILCDHNNKIWAGTSTGVYTNKDGSWAHLTRNENLQCDSITAVTCDSNNIIYFGSMGYGISVYDGVNWKYITQDDGLQTTNINDMVFDKNNVLHVIGTYSFSYYHNNTWTNYNGGGNDLYVDSKNRVLCSHTNGLTSFVDGTFTSVFSGSNTRASVEDVHGNIWLGGGGSNFTKLNTNYATDYDGDGVSDTQEVANGTSPYSVDSDDDSVDDYFDSAAKDVNVGENSVWFEDTDNDGYGYYLGIKIASSKPAGYVKNSLDCDDNSNAINPMARWYPDFDLDGYGNNQYVGLCICSVGYYSLVNNNTDCNDNDNSINPAAPLIDNGLDNNCNGITDNLEETTNVNKEIFDFGFKIFPNPTNGVISVYSGKPLGTITLINSIGTIVYSANVTDNSYTLDLSSLPKGIYFINAVNKFLKLVVD